MPAVLVGLFFGASVVIALLGAMYFIRANRGVPVLGGNGVPAPRWLHVFAFCFGCLGILSSAPSLFTDNPHWFVDKIYFAVSKLIAALE